MELSNNISKSYKEKNEVALFFDLDGTLWDAINLLTNSYNLTFKRLNISKEIDEEEVKSFMGLTPLETVKLIFKDKYNEEEGLKIFKEMVKDEIDYIKNNKEHLLPKLYDNELDILKSLNKSFNLFLVSNAEKGYIENYLDLFNLNNIFLDHLCAGDTLKDKHENIKILKDKYNIKYIIYIGDTKKDEIETLKVDSSFFIYASYGFGNIINPRYKINSFDELINVVNQIIIENNL